MLSYLAYGTIIGSFRIIHFICHCRIFCRRIINGYIYSIDNIRRSEKNQIIRKTTIICIVMNQLDVLTFPLYKVLCVRRFVYWFCFCYSKINQAYLPIKTHEGRSPTRPVAFELILWPPTYGQSINSKAIGQVLIFPRQ
jgi:hypothetical protein